ncbi:uncharacterized protein LOC134586034 isoform X2 [Pelobates fuscus]|uniref:uncharacterized protein LOC134586034 isoform X2 n=1 Tax=Pelobates fuscus TaxID=191477 RepID=UPI002FE48168
MDLQGTPVGSGQVPPIQSQPSGSSGAESLWIPVAEPQGGRGLEYLRPLSQIQVQQRVQAFTDCPLCKKNTINTN